MLLEIVSENSDVPTGKMGVSGALEQFHSFRSQQQLVSGKQTWVSQVIVIEASAAML